MKRSTLFVMFASAAGIAGAQTPVAPRPAPAPHPAPAPRAEAVAPRPPAPSVFMTGVFDYDQIERITRDARLFGEAARAAARTEAIDAAEIRRLAGEARATARASTDWFDTPALVQTGHAFEMQVLAPWAQGDPADSLYRVARDVLNRGEFSRAAQLFTEIWQKHQKSAYVAEAAYYEAYARYRIGTTEQLKLAARALSELNARAADMPRSRRENAASENLALAARIDGELARRGDRDASERVKQQGSQAGGASCDREDISVRVEALNSLNQLDPAAALPVLRKVLDRKDDCFVELRQKAVFMLGRRADNDATVILAGVAKSDPSTVVRSDALTFLARLPGETALGSIEEVLRSDADDRIQRSAVRALMASENPKARQTLRTLLERRDASLQVRLSVLSNFNSDRTTAEDAAYLRGYYARADNDQIKDGIINAVARIGGTENEQWMIGIVQNSNEPHQQRNAALSRLRNMQTIPITEFVKLYDASDSRSMRDQLVTVFRSRKETEATDKLIDIARTSTDPDVRTSAIRALMQKNDPRVPKILNELINK